MGPGEVMRTGAASEIPWLLTRLDGSGAACLNRGGVWLYRDFAAVLLSKALQKNKKKQELTR